MTITRARTVLLTVFLSGLVLQSAAMVYAFIKDRIYSDELTGLMGLLFQIYSIHFAIIIGGIFGGFQGGNKDKRIRKDLYFPVALLLVALWNVLLTWRSVAFGFLAIGTVPEIADYLKQVSMYSAWLVAGCLTFYFSKTYNQ